MLFDFGGVITESPFVAFANYERSLGLAPDTIRNLNATNPDANAWARMERSEVTLEQFCEQFEAEARTAGVTLSGAEVLRCLSGAVRPQMVRALDRLVEEGCRIGCITNNMRAGHGSAMARSSAAAETVADVMARFEVVIESSRVGLRKPDPAIYQLALDEMGLEANSTAYLDDLGINCKPAAQLGMAAIKVVDPDVALGELETLVGFSLA